MAAAVQTNEHWMRLSLANIEHGTQAIKDLLNKELGYPTESVLHSWFTQAKRNRKCKIPNYIWDVLLGQCSKGCPPNCTGKTNLDDLDVASLINVFNNLEHIVPSFVLPIKDIQNLKLTYGAYFDLIRHSRNHLAHYSSKKNKNMSNQEFNAQWNDIETSLIGLNYGQIQRFHALKTCSLDPLIESKLMVIMDTLKYLDEERRNMQIDLENKSSKAELKDLQHIVYNMMHENNESTKELTAELDSYKGII